MMIIQILRPWVVKMGLPWIAGLDANMAPKELEEGMTKEVLKGRVHCNQQGTPMKLNATNATNGNDGSRWD